MLSSIILKNYRNHSRVSFNFLPTTTFILGPNTSGKSNLLEAIYYLAIGRSHRAEKEVEVITYGENSANIEGEVFLDEEDKTIFLEVNLAVDPSDPTSRIQKRVKVNGVPRRISDFVGNFNVVLFSPEDIELVTDSPSLRRKFLDNLFCQFDKEYRITNASYQKVVSSRNRLLELVRDEGKSERELEFWNEKLLELGRLVSEKREEFFEFTKEMGGWLGLDYHQSVIVSSRLEEYKEREIAAVQTLIGPHRDDFTFLNDGRDLSTFGSRGEQRKATLQLKILEMSFLKDRTSKSPVLLLDDIFSELDDDNRREVAGLLKNQQTIVTTTEEEVVREFGGDAIIWLDNRS